MPEIKPEKSAEIAQKKGRYWFKPDWVKRAAILCDIAAWVVLVMGAGSINDAMPWGYGFFGQLFGVTIASWSKQYLYLALALFSGAFIVSLLGLLFNLRRTRKGEGRVYGTLIAIFAVSLLCTVGVLVRFFSVLF